MSVDGILKEAESKMGRSVEHLEHELATIRTGRANPALIERVMVPYYGTPTPLNQLAQISAPEPRLLVVQVYDRGQMGAVEKSIREPQLPVPPQISPDEIFERLDPAKDVDGLTPVNMGRLALGRPGLVPNTPLGILALIDSAGVSPAGRDAVIVGRSNIVGKPTALLLLARHATVTLCHSRTADLAAHTRRADILVSAVGHPHLIRAEMVKPGAVVIDVGFSRVNGRIVGDVDFDAVRDVAGAITPMPGGTGPMTIAMVLENTLAAARRQVDPAGV